MKVYEYGNTASSRVLIQMVDDHDLEFIENEVNHLLNPKREHAKLPSNNL